MTIKPPSDTDVEPRGDYITRGEFSRELRAIRGDMQGIAAEIKGIPQALRQESQSLRQEFFAGLQQSRPQGATIAAWVTAVLLVIFALSGALLYHINSGRDYDRLNAINQREADRTAMNMRFELERANHAMQVEAMKSANAEYHRLQEASQQQVWKEQNTNKEKLENTVGDMLFDGWQRNQDKLESSNHGRIRPQKKSPAKKSS